MLVIWRILGFGYFGNLWILGLGWFGDLVEFGDAQWICDLQSVLRFWDFDIFRDLVDLGILGVWGFDGFEDLGTWVFGDFWHLIILWLLL